MKFIYLVGGLIGIYAPTKMLYKYFFNAQRTIPPLTQRLINSLQPYKNANQPYYYQQQKYLKKRDAALSMTIDHQGRLQSPTIVGEQITNQKQQSYSKIYFHTIIHKNNIYFLNKDELVNQVEKINKKLNLKIEVDRILECIKPLIFYKYPLLHTSKNHSLQVIEIQINESENVVSVIDYPAKNILAKQAPLTLQILQKQNQQNIQNSNVVTIEIDQNKLIQNSQEGTLFLFYRESTTGQLICLQILDSMKSNSFCSSFKVLNQSKDNKKQKDFPLIKRLLSKMMSNSQEKIKFTEKKIYLQELQNLIKEKGFKEIVLLQSNGLIFHVNKVKLSEEGQEEMTIINNNKIFQYLNYYQNNFDIHDSLIFDQQIF